MDSDLFEFIDSTGAAGAAAVVNNLLGDSVQHLSLKNQGGLVLEAAAQLAVKLPSYIYGQTHWQSFAVEMEHSTAHQMSVRLPEVN
jgi:hypothetical protein